MGGIGGGLQLRTHHHILCIHGLIGGQGGGGVGDNDARRMHPVAHCRHAISLCVHLQAGAPHGHRCSRRSGGIDGGEEGDI